MHGGFGSALDYGFLMNDKDDKRGKRRRRRNLDGLVPVHEVQDLRIRDGHGGHLGSGFLFYIMLKFTLVL